MGNFLSKDKFGNTPVYKKELSEEEIKLLLTSTNMTRDQIVDFHTNFLIDCPNGIVRKKDFLRMYQQLHPSDDNNKKKKVEKFCEYVFKAIDKDSNEKIEFTDFVVCTSIPSFGDLKKKIDLAFKIYDLNKNGVVERFEMQSVIEALYDITGFPNHERIGNHDPKNKVELMMAKVDTNKNNVLEFEEFFNGCIEDSIVRKILIDPMFNC